MQLFKRLEVGIRRFRNRLTPFLYSGDARFCPCCQHSFSKFLPAGSGDRRRVDAVCPFCRSRERDRLLVLLLDSRPELFHESLRLLHFAPEPSIQRYLGQKAMATYETTDLMRTDVSFRTDIQSIDLASGSYESVICAHVMQDVPDEAAALSEVYRVLVPSGWAIFSVPLRGTETVEHGRAENVRAPWDARPDEHIRQYGLDFVERLQAARYDVEVIGAKDLLQSSDEVVRYGLGNDVFTNVIFFCRKQT